MSLYVNCLPFCLSYDMGGFVLAAVAILPPGFAESVVRRITLSIIFLLAGEGGGGGGGSEDRSLSQCNNPSYRKSYKIPCSQQNCCMAATICYLPLYVLYILYF